MPNGTGNFRNFQISRKKDNLRRLSTIFETNFQKRSVPFDFVPEFPEILVKWIAPIKFPCREGSPRLLKDKTHLPTSLLGIQELIAHQASGKFSRVLCISMPDARLTLGFPRVRSEGEFCL